MTFDLVDVVPAPTGKPTTPASLSATAGKGAITLTWSAIDTTTDNSNRLNDGQITRHQYRQSTDGGTIYGNWTDIPNSGYEGVNAASYTIDSLADSTEYTFQVRAVNGCTATSGCGIGDAATAVMSTPDADALARPTGLMATAGNTQVTLTWTDPEDAAILYYEYQQKEGGAAFGDWTEIPGGTATTTSYRLTGLTNGTAYSYRLRVGNRTSKVSLASDPVTATPQSVPPAAPELTATAANGAVALSWPDPKDDTVTGYEYQYRAGAGAYGPWQKAQEVHQSGFQQGRPLFTSPPHVNTDGTTMRFPVGGLDNGTAYSFRIRAVNSAGMTNSNVASATPVGRVPAKPTGLRTGLPFLRGDNQRWLTWDPVPEPNLRFEFSTDDGRTWHPFTEYSRAKNGEPQSEGLLPEDKFLTSGYTFRIRAVNDFGPGPASEPASETGVRLPTRPLVSASVEWNSTTRRATLVWEQTENPRLRFWTLFFSRTTHGTGASDLDATLAIGTTRYEIPKTFTTGDNIDVWISACISRGCGHTQPPTTGYLRFTLGVVPSAPTGFSAAVGSERRGSETIRLAWIAPTNLNITRYEYEVQWGSESEQARIPAGDVVMDAGNRISYYIRLSDHFRGSSRGSGNTFGFRLRAVNGSGNGAWTTVQQVEPPAPGTPAAPTGAVRLESGSGVVTTWDDPHDPSITVYQRRAGGRETGAWEDIPGTDATTTGVSGRIYFLRAVNANGGGPGVLPDLVHSPPPARPTGLRATPGNGRVTLTWDDPGKGVYIETWRYTAYTAGGEVTWTAIPGSATSGQGHLTRYTVQGLTNGQAYTFAIRAENQSVSLSTVVSPLSAPVTATPQGAAPAKPTGLSAAAGNAQATLTWDNPTDASITKYQVKQGSAAWADISGSDDDTTSHTVSGLTNGTPVTFQIRAVNDHNGDNTDDPGTASDAVSVTPGVPDAPATLSAAPGNAQVMLTWTAPASSNGSAVTGYEYTTNPDAAAPTWTDVPDGADTGTSRADETTYTVSSLTNNATYAFAVRAENANGQGAATPTVRAVPADPQAPRRPAAFRAVPGDRQVRLAWKSATDVHYPVTSYQYRQSTDGGTTWGTWTAISMSGADTTEHTLTSLTNGDTYTFELRGLKGTTAGPAARAQATPGVAAAMEVIAPYSLRTTHNSLTTADGSTYTVTKLSVPTELDWRITVPETTEIRGRRFTLRALQGTTPETYARYAFTSSGQEGLDISVDQALSGSVQVCLEPSAVLRSQAGSEPLLLLRHDGTWTVLTTTYKDGMVCAETSSFSAFVLGYRDAGYNEAPQAAQCALSPQTVVVGRTVSVNLAPCFTDENKDSLTYTVAPLDTTEVTPSVTGSELSLEGKAVGTASFTVTATDPGKKTATQTVTVRVEANDPPVAGPTISAQNLIVQGLPVLVDLTQYFRDDNGDVLTYSVAGSMHDTTVVTATVPPPSAVRPASGVLTLTPVNEGTTTVTVTAEDPGGKTDEQRVEVTVAARPGEANVAPGVTQVIPVQQLTVGGAAVTLELNDYFTDLNGDALTYTAPSPNANVVTTDVSGSQLTLTAVGAGTVVVQVTAQDPQPLKALLGVAVTVTGARPPAPQRSAPQESPADNAPPVVAQTLAPQTVAAGTTGEPLDLGPYFREPDGDPLTYVAVSENVAVAIADLPRRSSRLTLHGVGAGQAVVTVTASDPQGGSVSQRLTVTVTLTVPASDPPEVAQRIPPQIVAVGAVSEPLDLGPYFTDPDGDPLTYSAVSYDADVLVAQVAGGGSELTLRGVAAGDAGVIVTASDPYGGQASQPVTVTVRANTVPEAVQPIPAQVVAVGEASEPMDLAPYFHEADGDPLTYAAVSRDPAMVVAEVPEGGSRLVLRGVGVGEAVVEVTASDPDGAGVMQSLRVRTNTALAVGQRIPAQTVAAGTTSEPLDLAPYFHVADGVPLTFAAVSRDPGVVLAEVAAGGSQLTLIGVAVGEAVVDVTASDAYGGSVSQAVTVRTSPRPATSLPIPVQAVAVGSKSAPLDLAPYFHESDDVRLTYTAVSLDPDVVIVHVPAGSSQLVLGGVSVGEAVVIVTASDPWGGSVMHALQVRTNTAPAVAQAIPAQVATAGIVSAPLDLGPYFRDAEGDPLTCAAESDNTGVVIAEVPAGSSQLLLVGVAAGEAVVTITASDPWGGSVSQTLTVRTDPAPASQVAGAAAEPPDVATRISAAPQMARPLPAQVVAVGGRSAPLDLAPYFHDPDGAPLTYAAVSDDAAVVTAEVPAGSSQLVLRGVSVGDAVVTVTASDPYGGSASQTVTVRTNTAPAVVRPVPAQVVAVGASSEPLDLAPYFHDADGDPLTYAAVPDDTGVVTAEVPEGGSRLVLGGVAAGEAVVVVTAGDPHGGSVMHALRVRTNTAPAVAQPLPVPLMPVGGRSEPLDLGPYFHDADGDPLTYAAVSDNPEVVTADLLAGGSRLVLSGVAAGEAVVTVTASDPWGGSASQTLTVRTNTAPRVAQPIPSQVVAIGATSPPLDLGPYFHDADGDPLAYTAASDDTGVVVAEVVDGGSGLVLIGVAAGEAVVTVTASDPWGGSASQAMTVRTNTAPRVAQPIPAQVVAVGASSEPLDLAPYFHDADGDPLTYTAVSDDTGVVTAEVPEGGSRLVLGGVAAGEAVVTVTASDPWGGSAGQSLTVRTNTAPTVAHPIPAQVVAVGASSEPLDLAPYFHDADGDPLTYAAVSDDTGVVTAEVPEGGSRLVLGGVAAGEAVVTVTASDPWGGSAGQTVAVRTNTAPRVAQPIPAQVLAVGATSEPLDLAPYFHDADGDPLAYAAVSANPEVATADVAGALFTVTGVAAGAGVVTVTASDPHDAAASQSVTVTVRVADPAWVKAWIARFGRTVSGQVLDGVQERLRVARQPGFEATLAGHRVGGIHEDEASERGDPGAAAAFRRELGALAGWMDEQMDGPAGGDAPGRSLTGRDLLTSTAFTLTGGDADNGFGALWGRGVVSHFAGEDGALSLDGEVATGMLGADWVSGRWLTGLTLALSRGTGGYRTAGGSGDIESTLTGLYPWTGYRLSERLSLWAAAGYGAGTLTLTPQDEAPATTDLSLTLVAAGARSEHLPALGGVRLALETDTRLTRTTTGATAALGAADATVWQVRLGLEGSRRIALAGGGALRPSVEVGLRHDGGDAETGSGVELGAGLSFSRPASGLSLDLAARRLLAHRAPGLEEWGASASLTWDPTPSSDQGLSVSLQQTVGASSAGGVDALLARETLAAPGVSGGAGRLQARAGYGVPLGRGRFIGTPQLGFGLSQGQHDYTLGWHLSVARRQELDLTLGVEASRRENPDASDAEHGVMLQLRLGQ